MAINLKSLTVNKPKANIEEYVFTIYGRPKAGKTTLFAELCKKIYGDLNGGLLLGFETGYKALEVVAQDISNWKDFVDTVSQLVKEKAELPFKFIGIDTADVMYDYACKYVCQKKTIEDGKQYKVIGDIPYGGGYELVDKEIKEQLNKLIKSGYGLMILTHDTDKKFESRDGVSYDKTTCSLPKRARDTILNMSDFILFIDIAKEKNEEDKLVDHRYIYFRADGADLEAGSRFRNVPNKIEYDVDEFIKAFENAVLSSYNGYKVNIDKVKGEQKEEREQAVKKFIEEEVKQQEEKLPDDIKKEMKEILVKMDTETKTKVVTPKFKELLGTADFTKINDVAKLQEAIDFLNSLKK